VAIPHGARHAIAHAAASLAAVPPFSELLPVDRARLAAALEEAHFEAHEVIFAQGARADALYILREGLVERLADGVRLDVLEPPAVFGDLALLRDERRATTLAALTDCVVWRLPAERFTRLVRRTPALATFFAATVSGRLAARQQEVAALSQEFQGMAEHLYTSLTPREQQTLERAALLPELDERVVGPVAALPLVDVLLTRDGEAVLPRSYPPAFRRFLMTRMQDRLGAGGLDDARREVATLARQAGAHALAVQVLLEGDMAAEAVEVADREGEALRRANRFDEARRLARLLPAASLAEHPHLQEIAAWPMAEEPLEAATPTPWRLSRRLIGVVLAVMVLAVGWVVPTPDGLSEYGWHAAVALLAILPLLAFEVLPDGIVALVLAAIWIVGGVTTPAVALSGFATSNWVLVVTALAVGAAIASSGLLYRMALWTVANSRGGFAGRAIGLAVAGALIGPAVPNATTRVTLVAPAVNELVEALGYAPRSRASVGLAMAVLMGFGQMVALFLTSSSTSVLVYAVLPESSRVDLTWASWTMRALPTHVLLLAGTLAFIVWRYGQHVPEVEATRARRALALQRALLGPLSRHEVIAVLVTVLVVLGFAGQPLHRVDAAWVGVVALAVLAATGVLAANGLNSVNWSFALLSGILTSMSDVFAATQLDRWLAGLANQAVGGLVTTPVVFVAVLCGLCFVLSLVVRWQAAAPLLTISLAPVAMSAGIDPWVIAMVALIACNGFFLAYQSTIYLALYHGTNGRLFGHRQARPMAFAYAAISLVALCASVPIWRLMGLL
jgi:di/tricarboxylate transporter/CRP-like cAMP-binding protein